MCERRVYFNGSFVSERDAKISIYDSALMFGDMVFEMTRSFNKQQFKLKEHIDRLYSSAKWLHIPLTLTKNEMIEAVNKTVELNDFAFEKDDEHRVMINVTRGLLGIYCGVVGVENGTNVIIADFPLRWTVRGMGKLYDEGICAAIPSQRSIPSCLLEAKAKTRSRMHLMLANIQVSRMKGERNWALLLDSDGFISEGTGDNFFIVRGEQLITPEPRNILRGISREFVRELADSLQLCFVEKNIEPFDVMEADEAFMTGTPFCILPVVSLDGMVVGDGKPGRTTKRLLKEWGNKVGVCIEKQVQKWNWEDDGKIIGPSPYQFAESVK
jgi:branched-chain amino acid aminotransferase